MTNLGMLSGLRVLVVGLGQEGLALATYLANQGVSLVATDLQSEEKLGSKIAPLVEKGVSLVLGKHPISLLDEADILFVSPGISLESPFLKEAQRRKIPLSTESRLFCHLCPAPIMAITGSSGKTTTTTLVGKIMEADGRTTWVGGNIGRPLIEIVDQIKPEDAVVMELSSFQLEYFHARLNREVKLEDLPSAERQQLAALLGNWSPPIAAILNITPNHLDRHPSMKHYVRAKRALIDYQKPGGVIIMGLDNDMTRTIGNQYRSKVRWFSLEAQMSRGAGMVNNNLVLFDQEGKATTLAHRSEIKLRGAHNLNNILAACLIAREEGASIEAMRQVITSFTGVDHRLQLIREHKGVLYYNDSISTTPERIIAALHSFNEPIILLVGGRDKHLPWEDAARLMLHKTRAIVLFGEAADLVSPVINKVRHEIKGTQTEVQACPTLAEAVQVAAEVAKPGDVVLLSPGCASYDAFRNFMERGQHFRELVERLE
jgi:UDP-N-acetylmuramoylalanine--D-glutamate ligase